MSFQHFSLKWSASGAAERANKDAFLLELCDVLDVPRPDPATGDPERDLYVFERGVYLPHEGDRLTVGRIDLYKKGHFLLEAKQGSHEGSKKLGAARRGTPAWNIAMRDAYGQALGYARTLSEPPPFLVTCDIGYCFDLYAAFDSSWNYRPFPDGQASRIYLEDFEKYADRLRAIFLDPHSLDPAKHSARVTREIAAHLAELARELEESGQDPERVATFLMRCIFTLFAEDVGLLPKNLFTDALDNHWIPNPPSFPAGVMALWKAMNDGSPFGFLGKLLRFNGGLFSDQQALALTSLQLKRLKEAADCNWADVEPAIFGTLLERALDPRERHRLGAHYTPRSYVERLVRPTIEEPLRADWNLVQAEVRQLVEAGKVADAQKAIRTFHRRLTKTRVLDPACGSGNFLYVSLDLFKRLESEILGLLRDLGEKQDLLEIEGATVTPEQFRGIEVKRWAKEIAELVLWIGYIQWQVRARGSAKAIPEPVLRDYGNIEYRDALLAYERKELAVDEKGAPISRWDGITFKESPVTGEDIPDEAARVQIYRYVNPRKSQWPKADFVIGNPPFLGKLYMSSLLGEGYVEALRAAYRKSVPESADFVMYWWHNAAQLTSLGEVSRFGLVTTNSITQKFNSRVVKAALDSEAPIHIAFAIPDHPWIAEGAAVRIAMTVGCKDIQEGRLATIVQEAEGEGQSASQVSLSERIGIIHADLTLGANLRSATSLRSNTQLASMGPATGSRGFVLSRQQRDSLIHINGPKCKPFLKPLRNGRDLLYAPRDFFVIDLYGHEIADVRQKAPEIYQHLYDHVMPERIQNKDSNLRESWWQFRRSNSLYRSMLADLSRFIVTVETAKHRIFLFQEHSVIAEHGVIAFGLPDAFSLGILSSRIHVGWTLATGGTLENRPRYNKTLCFDLFPFPACGEDLIIFTTSEGSLSDLERF